MKSIYSSCTGEVGRDAEQLRHRWFDSGWLSGKPGGVACSWFVTPWLSKACHLWNDCWTEDWNLYSRREELSMRGTWVLTFNFYFQITNHLRKAWNNMYKKLVSLIINPTFFKTRIINLKKSNTFITSLLFSASKVVIELWTPNILNSVTMLNRSSYSYYNLTYKISFDFTRKINMHFIILLLILRAVSFFL